MNDKDKRLSEVFKVFRREPHSRGFGSFSVFRSWSYRNSYEEGAALAKIDPDKPFSEENCYWDPPAEREPNEREVSEKVMTEDYCYIIAKWDRFVDGVRQALGMPPIMTADPCTGCPNARKCELFDTVCKTRMRWWDKKMADIRHGAQEGWNG